jgi:hypothetical protein
LDGVDGLVGGKRGAERQRGREAEIDREKEAQVFLD